MNSIEKKDIIIINDNKMIDPSIELLRIIGCLCVIGTHIKLDLKQNDEFINFTRIIIGCFCADGVSIFWNIMGFFLFNKTPYKKRLKILFNKIYIPVIITSFFYFYFQKYDFNKIEFMPYILKKSKIDYLNLFYKSLCFEGWHLWFCYVYILIILLYPSFEGLNNIFEKYKINSPKILLIFLFIFIENDFLYNNVLMINHHGFNAVLGAIPFIFYGNELKKNINKFKNKRIYGFIILIFIGLNFLRSYLIKIIGDTFLIKWYTSFGIINSFCLFIFVYSFNDLLYNKIAYFIITKIGSMTFYIYLIHNFIIRNIFKAYQIDKKFHKNSKSIKGNIKYQIYSVLFIFISSLIISIGISILKIFLLSFIKLFLKKLKIN